METIQVCRFQNGGFVLHRITGSFSGRVSAWFDASAEMIDAERIDPRGVSHQVKRDGPIWNRAQRFGARYRVFPETAKA